MLEEYKTIILLNAILDIQKKVKNAIEYGRDTLTLEIVIDSLKSKEMELRSERKYGEIHMMRGGPQFRNQEGGSKKKGKSKTQGKGKKCYSFGKIKNFIKDCYAEKVKQKKNERDHKETNVVTSYYSSKVY